MAKEGRNLDTKRIFYSDVTDDNELHVIVGKVTIVRVASKVGLKKYRVLSTQLGSGRFDGRHESYGRLS